MSRTLTWPGAPAVGRLTGSSTPRLALVGLPGAHPSTADQPLFTHLAAALEPAGVALLTYDRRQPATPGNDTTIEAQAADAREASRALRRELDVPVGLFGFSQGAWVAARAADEETACLVVVGLSAVSPAEQMRHACDEALRRRGFSHDDRAALREVRLAAEDVLRGGGDAARADALLAKAASQPWFAYAALPPALPPGARWDDLDHDPGPALSSLTCPVLAAWGEDEECVPLDAGRAALPDATKVLLAGCGHWPGPGSGEPGFDHDRPDVPFSDQLGEAVRSWLPRT